VFIRRMSADLQSRWIDPPAKVEMEAILAIRAEISVLQNAARDAK